MKASTQRNFTRWLHIAVGSAIATYIYSPWGENPAFQFITKAIVIPLTVVTGLWLWKGHLVRKYFSNSGKVASLFVVLFLGSSCLLAQTENKSTPKSFSASKIQRWGAEFSPIGAGVFRLAQGKVTYAINPQKQWKSEIGLGFLLQPESKAKTSDAFNKDGLYSAYMASLAYRQYFWKGLHFEEVVNFGKGSISNSKVDGKDYDAFVIFMQTFLGYKFNVVKKEKFIFFIIGQGGFGYVPLNTNQWPRKESTSIYGLGDLKIGFNF